MQSPNQPTPQPEADSQKAPEWFAELLTVNDTKDENGNPVISKQFIEGERASGMPEELIRQEYFGDPNAPLVGAYYAKEMAEMTADEDQTKHRICHVPIHPEIPVNTCWDLGIDEDDTMFVWFMQFVGREFHWIDCYGCVGEGMPHMAKVLKERADKARYQYGLHYFPHDMGSRELGPGKSRIDTAKSLGLVSHRNYRIVEQAQKHMFVEEGIQAVRNILPRCWMDRNKCADGINALRQYTKKFDPKTKIHRPVHNWASHASDAFRCFAMGFKDNEKRTTENRQTRQPTWNPLDQTKRRNRGAGPENFRR